MEVLKESIPKELALTGVHSLHAADCSVRIAVRFWGIVAIGDNDGARRATAIGAHLLPRSRRPCLRYGLGRQCIY